jgi:hypothetical protein
MFPTDNNFQALLNRVRDGEVEPGQARQRLEDDLTPLVRRVMRTGYGPPAVVQWLEEARSRLAPTLSGLSFDHASRYLGRLLSSAVLDRYSPRTGGTVAAWETVAG